jgi:hypothetical protein
MQETIQKMTKSKKGLMACSNGRVPSWQALGPEFKPQYKKKNLIRKAFKPFYTTS